MSPKARRLVRPAGIETFEWSMPSVQPEAQAQPEDPAPEPREESARTQPADEVEHSARLAALERDAFVKGFAEGERAGAEAARERADAMLRRLTQAIDDLASVRAEMIQQTERQLVELALAIARRIVHREVSLDADLLIAMARVALERLGESLQVTVRLHPDEFAATSAARDAAWGGTTVQVVADPRVGRGGCRVESEFGMVDAGVDAQIQELARALLGREDGAPDAAVR